MRRLHATLGFLLALTQALAARADDVSDIQSILSENVITTASTTSQTESAAPATSTTITAEDLRLYGVRTLAEAVNFLSLGVMSSDPLRSPDMGSRGVLLTNDDGKHFLLLIDGHAINDPLYGAARFDQGAGIPIDAIDRIEIIIGPGSVLYGSNAMLGVINVITKPVSSYSGGHVLGEIEPGRSYRAGAGAGFELKLFGTTMEVVAAADYYEQFGPDLTFDRQVFPPIEFGTTVLRTNFRRGGNADNVWGGTVRDAYFVQAPSGIVRLRAGDFEIGLTASSYRRGIPYSNERTLVDFDDPESYELDRAIRADVKHHAALSTFFQLTSRAYADAFGYRRVLNGNASLLCSRQDFATCTFRDVGLTRWGGIEERASLNWLGDMRLVTLLGIDMRGRWVGTKQDAIDYDTGNAFAPTSGRFDYTGFTFAPYLQQTYDPTPWLALNAGARVDIDDRFDPVVSPRGAVSVSPATGMTVKGVYSGAFRAPTLSETNLANYQVAPSDDLRPETVRSVEGSIEQRFGTQRVRVNLFRTWWNDLVASQPLSAAEQLELQEAGVLPFYVPPGITRFTNVARLHNYGWSGGWDGTLVEGRLRYGTSVTSSYTRREVGERSELLAVAPDFFGNLHFAYVVGGYFPTPALAASYFGPRLIDRRLASGHAYASRAAELRFTLTGALPAIPGLGYRASAAFITTSETPYSAGPDVTGTIAGGFDTSPPPVGVAPADQFRVFFGLRYDFAGETAAAKSGEDP